MARQPEDTQTLTLPELAVPRKRGRPSTGKAMTAAERQRRRRRKMGMGDWDTARATLNVTVPLRAKSAIEIAARASGISVGELLLKLSNVAKWMHHDSPELLREALEDLRTTIPVYRDIEGGV